MARPARRNTFLRLKYYLKKHLKLPKRISFKIKNGKCKKFEDKNIKKYRLKPLQSLKILIKNDKILFENKKSKFFKIKI